MQFFFCIFIFFSIKNTNMTFWRKLGHVQFQKKSKIIKIFFCFFKVYTISEKCLTYKFTISNIKYQMVKVYEIQKKMQNDPLKI